LSLDEYRYLSILRFVADKSRQDGAPETPVDLHTVLLGLAANYPDSLSYHDFKHLRRYERRRRVIETLLFQPERTVDLLYEDREEYKIAEMRNSDATGRAVRIMLHLHFPSTLCMTTASLMNSTKPGGLFHDLLSCCRTIIADEASQIPEPVSVSRFLRKVVEYHSHIKGTVHDKNGL
uniref:SNF2_N domain-containing protein n=1 Tax=Haemonchus placei TaxID=6290 RepID=A0A0N4WG90_HAEPC